MAVCPNPKGLTAAAVVLLASAAALLLVGILYLAFTDYSTVDQTVLYYEAAIVFAGVVFAAAAIYLYFSSTASENYKKILAENWTYEKKGPRRSCPHGMLAGNTYLITGWLALLGAAPLILYPTFFPYMMVVVVAFIMVFILVLTPPLLAFNAGKGSLLCGMVASDANTNKYFGSDVLIMLLAFAFIGVFFLINSIINLVTNYANVTAWLWFVAAFLFTIGMALWYRHSIPKYGGVNEEQSLRSALTEETDERA